MSGKKIGGSAVANNIDNLIFASGALKNVAEINNGAGLTKTTNGTLTLAGTNGYTGATNVNAGTVVVSGSISGTAAVNVGDGTTAATLIANGAVGNAAVVDVKSLATLRGSGTISSSSVTVESGGTLAPGASATGTSTGTLTLGSGFTLSSGAHLALEIGGTTAGFNTNGTDGYDQLVVGSGNVSLAGDLAGSTLSFSPALGTDIFYVILNNGAGTTTGTLNGVAEGGSVFISGQEFEVSYTSDFGGGGFAIGGSGNDVALKAIPEPSAAISLLGGFGLLLGLHRRRFRRTCG